MINIEIRINQSVPYLVEPSCVCVCVCVNALKLDFSVRIKNLSNNLFLDKMGVSLKLLQLRQLKQTGSGPACPEQHPGPDGTPCRWKQLTTLFFMFSNRGEQRIAGNRGG